MDAIDCLMTRRKWVGWDAAWTPAFWFSEVSTLHVDQWTRVGTLWSHWMDDLRSTTVVHPHDADTVYVLPLEPATRTCPGGAPAVWRSENGGESWSRLARGLPKKESYFTVLRDGMDIDELKSPALYFGTTTGQLWIGRDGGEKFECLFDSLPPIHNVKVAIV